MCALLPFVILVTEEGEEAKNEHKLLANFSVDDIDQCLISILVL